MKKLLNDFKNPTSEFRGKPFWAWNGKIEKEELLRQVKIMSEMGMGGYFCHSRTGLVTEYLGDEWFSLINACADEGEKYGLETWLYDEDRWPSGTAGGMVTKHKEFRMKYIRLSIIDAKNFDWQEGILAAFSVELDGFSFTNKKRIYCGDSPADCSVLVFTIEEMAKSSFYNGFTYVDTMNRAATEKYLELTHNKYLEKCGDRLGKSIKGIFTDEPHRGSVMCGFSLPNENPEYLTPYTNELFSRFMDEYCLDLVDYLPELFLWENGEKIHPVKWKYMQLIQQLFLDNFLQPMQRWCSDNNLALTGHVLHEDTLTAQACMIGSVMRAYEYMDYPGVDILGEHNYNYWIVKQLSSVARQLGKKNMMSELYGCTGWQMSFKNHKDVGDWQALMGINLRCHHLSWYSMAGQAKRDFPASILHQSAWYKEYKYIEDYYARIHVLLSQGQPICDVLIINPVESAWCIINPKWSWYLSTLDSDMVEVEKCYKELFNILMENGIDFDYGDEDMISRLYHIEKVGGETYLCVGNAKYRFVILGRHLTIRGTTIAILKEFIAEGGKVVFAGEPPEYIDAVKNKEALTLDASFIPFNEDAITNTIKSPALISACDENRKSIKDIYLQVRKTESEYIFALMNINRDKEFKNVQISIHKGGYLEQWDARDGMVYMVAQGKDSIVIHTDFAVSDEKLYVLSHKNNQYESKEKLEMTSETVLPKKFVYSLTEPNVCVLDFARYCIESGKWQEKQEILKIDEQIRTHFSLDQRGGEMIQPWYSCKDSMPSLGLIELEFDFFIKDVPKDIMLACETPECFKIFINDKKLEPSTNNDYWCDSCFKLLPINSDHLLIGQNKINISCNFSDGINLEALYLLGDFGVALEGACSSLYKQNKTLSLGDITCQGLPFYGAGVHYELGKIEMLCDDDSRIFLEIKEFKGACIKVLSDEHEKILAFPPYEIDITDIVRAQESLSLELILTRRNTFGPLHQNPNNTGGVDPNSFIRTGDGFMDDGYGLMEQGVFGDIKLMVKSKMLI